jgi:hypothetical protein
VTVRGRPLPTAAALVLGLVALAPVGSVGCWGRRQQAEIRYGLGALPAAWKPGEASGGADYSWFNRDLYATIYTDASCGDRFQDGALRDLLTHLTAGMAQGAPLREEALRLDSRDALLRVYDVELDGVALRMGAAVTIQAPCTYDLVYLAPRDRFEEGWADFVGLVSGFDASAAPP